MIQTNIIRLTAKECFWLLLRNFLRKRWWMFVLAFALAIWFLFDDQETKIDVFVYAFAIALPFIVVLQYWTFSHSRQNSAFLEDRYYEITAEKITGYMASSTSHFIERSRFIKKVKTKKYYLLFISDTQFVYLPFAAFKSTADLEWFEMEIAEKI